MQVAFREAGVPVRDMIDTEALILTCWEDRQFWAEDDDGRRARSRPPDHYLAACAIYRDEAALPAEWLEFHRLVGFERFYLYNNLSTDHHSRCSRPYLEEGLVVVHDWPQFPGQLQAYDHCLAPTARRRAGSASSTSTSSCSHPRAVRCPRSWPTTSSGRAWA